MDFMPLKRFVYTNPLGICLIAILLFSVAKQAELKLIAPSYIYVFLVTTRWLALITLLVGVLYVCYEDDIHRDVQIGFVLGHALVELMERRTVQIRINLPNTQ